jgi:hypothetical protein
VKELAVGSVSNSCVHHSRCPVVVIHFEGENEDGSPQPGTDLHA